MTHTQDGAINAIAAGCLPAVLAALAAAEIDPMFWEKILMTVRMVVNLMCTWFIHPHTPDVYTRLQILSTVRGFDLYRYDRDTDIGMDRDIDIDIVV